MRNRRCAGWLFVLVPACFHPSYDHPTCGPNGECPSGLTCSPQRVCEGEGASDSGTPDVTDGTPDAASRCFGSFDVVCFNTLADLPKAPVILTEDLTIDTGSSTMCDQHNDQMTRYCVVAGAGFTLSAFTTIRAYGTKPLILLSASTMTLQGASTIDVRSTSAADPHPTGADANPTACISGTPPEMAGGGYGGSLGGKGGDGERLTGAAPTSGVAVAALPSPPTQLRGGCPGGNGDKTGGLGGSGGGAVELIAAMSIQLDGTINASGAGGHGGPATQSGGGGGGSGGMIVLDAPSITAGDPLFANGGSGGQGGAGTGTGMGIGADGGESPDPPTQAPAGSNGGRDGGFGGTGSSGTRLPGNNGGIPATAQNDGGGGGGGGGAGFIRAHGVTVNIAPPSFVP